MIAKLCEALRKLCEALRKLCEATALGVPRKRPALGVRGLTRMFIGLLGYLLVIGSGRIGEEI